MNVIVAENAGACYGVKRALDLALDAASKGSSVQTLGPIIHNPQVVGQLEKQGVYAVDKVLDITADSVIIRSHGVTPQVHEEIEQKGIEIIDATCPHVVRAQRAAYDLSENGYTVLVVGEPEHPEVLGLQAWGIRGGSQVYIVSSLDDIPSDLVEPIGIVVQTTQTRSLLQQVVEELHKRGLNFEVRDTICSSTSKRQAATIELSKKVDAMVVVGGRNSSNTTRLFELCKQYAPYAFHVETAHELSRADFKDFSVIGVSAGASTPDDQIQAVVDCLRSW